MTFIDEMEKRKADPDIHEAGWYNDLFFNRTHYFDRNCSSSLCGLASLNLDFFPWIAEDDYKCLVPSHKKIRCKRCQSSSEKKKG